MKYYGIDLCFAMFNPLNMPLDLALDEPKRFFIDGFISKEHDSVERAYKDLKEHTTPNHKN